VTLSQLCWRCVAMESIAIPALAVDELKLALMARRIVGTNSVLDSSVAELAEANCSNHSSRLWGSQDSGPIFARFDAGKHSCGRICARGRPASISKWVTAGCTAVVTLLRSDEGAVGCGAQCQKYGLKWMHLPLSGKRAIITPLHEDRTSLARVGEIAKWLSCGESVVVHCAAGMHRTGVVCYLVLRLLGLSQHETLDTIHATRPVTHQEITKCTRKHKPLCELAEDLFLGGEITM